MQSGSTKPHRLIHPRTNMDIIENPMEWLRAYQLGFLAHYKSTGQYDWDRYIYPTNKLVPGSPAVDITTSSLLVISSAGAYLESSQIPFADISGQEDYTVRLIPIDVAPEEIVYSSSGPRHENTLDAPQITRSLQHLRWLTGQGKIGTLLPLMVSHCCHQPHAIRVVKEVVSEVLQIAEDMQAQAALLLPDCRLGNQTAGLLARALEVNGVATVVVSSCQEVIRQVAPPRTLLTDFASGVALGGALDTAGQIHVIEAALSLLNQDAPLQPVPLNGNSCGN